MKLWMALFSLVLAVFSFSGPGVRADIPMLGSLKAARAGAPEGKTVTAYSLPPAQAEKVSRLGSIHFRFAIFGLLYQLVILWGLLHFGVSARLRDWAEKKSELRWVQAFIYIPLFLLGLGILSLPLDIYEYLVSREFGLSIQGWGSWLADWMKEQGLGVVFGMIVISLLFWVIRRDRRRWWFYFWLASLPILVATEFLQPLVVDPLFHHFEPLQSKAPELTARLEEMVRKAGQDIPPERMFWMGAGEKTTTLNAYVSGVGASKRIVVWDTTIAKMTTPQIVFVAGHEMGHYVLGHVWKGLIVTALLFFILFYMGYRLIGSLLNRNTARWRVRGVDDWAAFPALMLLFSFLMFLTLPLMNALSRHIEHQADQYGLEVTHDLQPSSAQVAAQAFQVLGEVDLSEVHPLALNVLLFYSHPTINERIHFALTYDPWSTGGVGEFVRE